MIFSLVVLCVAFAYMSVLDCQQHVTTSKAADGVGVLPASFSLNDLMSHAASPIPLCRDVTTTAQRSSALQPGEFSALTGEFRSVRQSSAGIFVDSQRTFQSAASCVGNFPPSINVGTDSMSPVDPQQNVGCGVYITSPQRVNSIQGGQVAVPMSHTIHDVLAPARHTRPSLDLDREVFSDTPLAFSVDQPPPLPPKTSVVSVCVCMCVCVCLNITLLGLCSRPFIFKYKSENGVKIR